jgi:hypothetical protein
MAAIARSDDIARAIEPVARACWGEPNSRLSTVTELRWGAHGSRKVDLEKCVWFDHEVDEGGGVLDLLKREMKLANGEALDWLRQEGLIETRSDAPAEPPRIHKVYTYTDEAGVELFDAVRFHPKRFAQRRRARPTDEPAKVRTGYVWSLGGVRLVPYHLPTLLSAAANRRVFIVEGEKDVEALEGLGLVATCNPMGAGKWPGDFAGYFKDRLVTILPDNDAPGREHAAKVAAALMGTAASVKILELPGLPPKGDVSDWIAAGGSRDELIHLDKAAPEFEARAPSGAKGSAGRRGISAAELQSTVFAPIKYVVDGYIAEGLTLVAGKPKLGKSWLVLDICVAVARGGFTLGDTKCAEGDVLYCALEDNPRRLKERMAKVCPLGDWPRRLHFWTEMERLEDGGIDALRSWIIGQEKPRLVVIDVLNKVRASKGRTEDSYAHDYRSMAPLKALADEFGVAVVVIHHTRKMAADDPLEGVSGTNGLTGAADTILVLNRDANGVTLYGRGRDIREIETAVEFQKDVCRWRVLGSAQDVRMSEQRRKVLAALADAGAVVTPSELVNLSGMGRANIDQLLLHMSREGEVRKLARGKYAHPDLDLSKIDKIDKKTKVGEIDG